ncbi:hypothetical protein B296_00036772 [Ensete ventricosum]|uniref:S1 motif domain-containing protein n=1 Tax=Ensete ventricosum TaxID=4639 RepID=A0A426X5Q7_ENSVE|nr:hypothetical protein B296_00036772 [Ensete ventricosum]
MPDVRGQVPGGGHGCDDPGEEHTGPGRLRLSPRVQQHRGYDHVLRALPPSHLRSVSSVIKVGLQEPIVVLRVDRDKGYIDLSKRRVSMEDIEACEERYNRNKLVHSIMRHVAETLDIDLEELYIHIGWPLYRKYGHAFEVSLSNGGRQFSLFFAFKIIVTDPDSVLDALTRGAKEVLFLNLKNTHYSFGIPFLVDDAIVLDDLAMPETWMLLQVSERDDKLLAEHKLQSANTEVESDEGSEEEDTGTGGIDVGVSMAD